MRIHLAKTFQQKGIDDLSHIALVTANVFAVLFIAGQLWLWQQLGSAGYSLNSNPANSFFYLLTGVHGVHLLIGIAVLLHTSWGSFNLSELYLNYLLGLWLVLLALLTSKQETLEAIASFCGL